MLFFSQRSAKFGPVFTLSNFSPLPKAPSKANQNILFKIQPIIGKKKTIVLLIDRGGIRGIVPLVIPAVIEKYFIPTSSLNDYFDFAAGTSTVSVIVAWPNKV